MGSCGAFKAYVSIERKDVTRDNVSEDLYLDVSDDIYYENDNSCSESFTAT